jgi:hypothetical protein
LSAQREAIRGGVTRRVINDGLSPHPDNTALRALLSTLPLQGRMKEAAPRYVPSISVSHSSSVSTLTPSSVAFFSLEPASSPATT